MVTFWGLERHPCSHLVMFFFTHSIWAGTHWMKTEKKNFSTSRIFLGLRYLGHIQFLFSRVYTHLLAHTRRYTFCIFFCIFLLRFLPPSHPSSASHGDDKARRTNERPFIQLFASPSRPTMLLLLWHPNCQSSYPPRIRSLTHAALYSRFQLYLLRYFLSVVVVYVSSI